MPIDENFYHTLCLINENNLIVCGKKILLINIKEFKSIYEIKNENESACYNDIFYLNEKNFIIYGGGFRQYEIDIKSKKKIIMKGCGVYNSSYIISCIDKYPGKKLIVGNGYTIFILGE